MNKVELLSTLEPNERVKLIDACKQLTFKAGQMIIKEGDAGNDLCLL